MTLTSEEQTDTPTHKFAIIVVAGQQYLAEVKSENYAHTQPQIIYIPLTGRSYCSREYDFIRWEDTPED